MTASWALGRGVLVLTESWVVSFPSPSYAFSHPSYISCGPHLCISYPKSLRCRFDKKAAPLLYGKTANAIFRPKLFSNSTAPSIAGNSNHIRTKERVTPAPRARKRGIEDGVSYDNIYKKKKEGFFYSNLKPLNILHLKNKTNIFN